MTFLHSFPHTRDDTLRRNPCGSFQPASIYLISSYFAVLGGVEPIRLDLCPRGAGKGARKKGGATRDNERIIEDKM